MLVMRPGPGKDELDIRAPVHHQRDRVQQDERALHLVQRIQIQHPPAPPRPGNPTIVDADIFDPVRDDHNALRRHQPLELASQRLAQHDRSAQCAGEQPCVDTHERPTLTVPVAQRAAMQMGHHLRPKATSRPDEQTVPNHSHRGLRQDKVHHLGAVADQEDKQATPLPDKQNDIM